ncbi:cardiolipin synthetase [Bacillus sp. JCM 19046]|nr:cardiolipin synthetase [Bacillus sp. JCM 19046]
MWLIIVASIALAICLWFRFDYNKGLRQLRRQDEPSLSGPYHSDTQLFITGEDFFDALLNDITSAKKHVHIQFYIFRSDSTGQRVIDALCDKAKENLEVRLLVDQFGCKINRKLKKQLVKAGVNYQCSAPARWPLFFFSFNQRNHRKLAVIDGAISYIGGFNVGDEYLSRNPFFGFWRDYHLRITGEGSKPIQNQFLTDFAKETKLPNRQSFYPTLLEGKQPLYFISTQGVGLEEQLLKLINDAKKSLLIGSPYFIPTQALQESILAATKRGVTVSLVLPEKADHPLVKHGATPFLRELIDAGVLVYHYYRGFYHVKAMIVDKQTCFIGTANFDRRSMHLNDEMSCITTDPTLVSSMQTVFDYDLSTSTNVTEEKLFKRPLLDKVKERIATPFVGLL